MQLPVTYIWEHHPSRRESKLIQEEYSGYQISDSLLELSFILHSLIKIVFLQASNFIGLWHFFLKKDFDTSFILLR